MNRPVRNFALPRHLETVLDAPVSNLPAFHADNRLHTNERIAAMGKVRTGGWAGGRRAFKRTITLTYTGGNEGEKKA